MCWERRFGRSGKRLNNLRILLLFEFIGSFSFGTILIRADSSECEGIRPIADPGLPRYVAAESVHLDGRKSYDPDNSGTLSYT